MRSTQKTPESRNKEGAFYGYNAQYQAYLNTAETALAQQADRCFNERSRVCEAARYSLFGGGKRVRAVLCLAVCDMLDGNRNAAACYAAGVEMLHCYSLIHDDLPCMDNDDMQPEGVRRATKLLGRLRLCWQATLCLRQHSKLFPVHQALPSRTPPPFVR